MRPSSGNFGDLMHQAVVLTPEKIAVIGEWEELSYRQLDERIRRAGNVFRRKGIEKGDRVALLFPNDLRYIEMVFGLMRIGAVPVPLNIKLEVDTLAYILRDSGAKILVFHGNLESKAKQLEELDIVDELIRAGEGKGNPGDYERLRDAADTYLETVNVADDDLCFLPYTSGSTGRPKGCMLTHGGQWWNADMTRKAFFLDHDDRAVVSVPLYHKNAMICAVKPCLIAGASFVIRPDFQAIDVIATIDRYKCTYTTGVPAMFKMILSKYKDLQQYDVSSLRFIVCGSSEVPMELMNDLKQTFHIKILEAYGLTEGGPQVFVTPRWGIHKQGSSGLPLLGCEVQVVDKETERVLPPNEIGELWVRSPGVVKSYWNRPELANERFRDGWLKTGDLAYLDEDGYGYIVGRKDDMINIGGENAYPKEIEQILLKHEAVEDVCVVSIPHELKGAVPAAFIKRKPEADISEEAIKQFFINNGPVYAHPRVVSFLEEMPLSGTGKVDKQKLKELALTLKAAKLS